MMFLFDKFMPIILSFLRKCFKIWLVIGVILTIALVAKDTEIVKKNTPKNVADFLWNDYSR